MEPNITSTYNRGVGTTVADSGLRTMPPPSTGAIHQLEAILASVRRHPLTQQTPGPAARGPVQIATPQSAMPAENGQGHLGFGMLPDENQARWDVMNNPDQSTIHPTAGWQPGSVFTGWRP